VIEIRKQLYAAVQSVTGCSDKVQEIFFRLDGMFTDTQKHFLASPGIEGEAISAALSTLEKPLSDLESSLTKMQSWVSLGLMGAEAIAASVEEIGREFCSIFRSDGGENVHEKKSSENLFNHMVSDLTENFSEISSLRRRAEIEIPDSEKFLCLRVSFAALKSQVDDQITHCRDLLVNRLKNILKNRLMASDSAIEGHLKQIACDE
jgi:hypothetical protein